MNLNDLKSQVVLGEDSRRQLKRDVTNVDSVAAEMAAFANSEGGVIYLGVADDGELTGLSRADVTRINPLIANAASQHIRSPLTVQTENLELDSGRLVIVLTVPKGIDKPLSKTYPFVARDIWCLVPASPRTARLPRTYILSTGVPRVTRGRQAVLRLRSSRAAQH